MKPIADQVKIAVNSLNKETVTEAGIVLPSNNKNDEFAMVWTGTLLDVSPRIADDKPCAQTWKELIGTTVVFDKRGSKALPNQEEFFVKAENIIAILD